ncbi:hypothetical protein [Streptomyces sp. NRRL S-87]|uniref:hypothetical protein n=1 Tax=Streptomyces sp. NRRL S-87 TaxID=1463920 RepID=UPI00131CD953|nr:hypothetical protein [Streptomyces sp. NRRL S-87]
MSESLWAVLAEEGGNVSGLYRRIERAHADGGLGEWGVGRVPSLSTLQRVVLRDLRAGRVLEVARPSRNRVEVSRYERVLADLKLQREGEGLPVVDAVPQAPGVAESDEENTGASRGGVRLFVPGARVVSAAGVAAVVEAAGHTVAARGMACVFGEPGAGKTVAVQQALHSA